MFFLLGYPIVLYVVIYVLSMYCCFVPRIQLYLFLRYLFRAPLFFFDFSRFFVLFCYWLFVSLRWSTYFKLVVGLLNFRRVFGYLLDLKRDFLVQGFCFGSEVITILRIFSSFLILYFVGGFYWRFGLQPLFSLQYVSIFGFVLGFFYFCSSFRPRWPRVFFTPRGDPAGFFSLNRFVTIFVIVFFVFYSLSWRFPLLRF